MKKFLLVALIALSVCWDEEYAFKQFQKFVTKYNKKYKFG